MICLVKRSGKLDKLHLSFRSFICFLDCFRKSYIESGHSKSSLWNTRTMIVVRLCSGYPVYFQRCTHAGGPGTCGRFHGAYLILVPSQHAWQVREPQLSLFFADIIFADIIQALGGVMDVKWVMVHILFWFRANMPDKFVNRSSPYFSPTSFKHWGAWWTWNGSMMEN